MDPASRARGAERHLLELGGRRDGFRAHREADRESEQAVIRKLNCAFPDHSILAEESGANARQNAHRWIIDPLDGTTNFAHGFPQFCVSIAYERCGRLELAVVFDALKRELFVAARGRGARLNGRPIHVSATPSLESPLLATAFPYDQRERRKFLFDLLGGLHDAHAGSAAYGFRRAGPLLRRVRAG
jgi:myo-inositol-1(or 4)-monophosphatase